MDELTGMIVKFWKLAMNDESQELPRWAQLDSDNDSTISATPTPKPDDAADTL
jgi:hypothetical protein